MSKDKVVFSIKSGVTSPAFIASADIHLGKKLYNCPELEEDLRDNFVRLVDMAIDKNVQYLVIAGDLFENNNYVRPNMITFVSSQVARLKNHGGRMVGVAGDHDKPVQKEAWMHISGIEPVTIEPAFAGLDYFDYSTVTPEELVKLIKGGRDCSKVMWMFLHCQFPQLFKKAEAKKTVDYNKLRLFENFPNIQGVIAGDIHFAPETKAYGVGHEAYVGYPGSLGVTDKSEYKHDKHVLYCDGSRLMHLPFPLSREFKDIDFRGDLADKFDVALEVEWSSSKPVKPVVYLYYDMESEKQLHKLTPLYQYALVIRNQVALGVKDPASGEMLSCRTEVSTSDKIDKALIDCCGNNDELYQLSSALLKDDPKEVLDKFKAKHEL